ncbi:phosphotransferase enzyme family protein [Longispora urticae]
MKDRPEGVTESALVAALADGWGVTVRSVAYLPVGAGSYHWAARVGDPDGPGSGRDGPALFVTVDDLGHDDRDLAFGRLGRAMDTASALRRDADLGFVVAPVPARTGATVWRLAERYSVAVFPLLDGHAGRFGPHPGEHRAEMVGLLAALHAATPLVTPPPADRDLPGRERLEEALGLLDRAWTGGPYAERTRALLTARADHVTRLLGELDRLAGQVLGTPDRWVVTHGEPHPGNVLRTAAGPQLIDWDTVRLGPPERDLWLVTDDADILAGYTRATGRAVDPAGLALYRLWWELADIAVYVDGFRRPHRETADSAASWTYLTDYLGTP